MHNQTSASRLYISILSSKDGTIILKNACSVPGIMLFDSPQTTYAV